MPVEVEEISPTERKLTITVEKDRVTREMESRYKDLAKNADIRGFRKGKAPRHLLQRYYGEAVAHEVARQLIEESLASALKEHRPVSQPVIDFDSIAPGKEFIFTAAFEVVPPVELKKYTGLQATLAPHPVEEEQIDERLGAVQKQQATLEPIDPPRPLEAGDHVFLTMQEGPHDTPAPLELDLGEEDLIPDLEQGLLGMSIGDEKDITVTFGDDRQDTLAGQSKTFHVAVTDAKRRVIPPLDDELAKDVGYDSLDDWRAAVREELEAAAADHARDHAKADLVTALVEANPCDAPPALVENEINAMLQNEILRTAIARNMDPRQIQVDKEAFRESARDDAEKRVKATLLLEALADKEDLTVPQSALDARIAEMAQQRSMDPVKMRAQLERQNELSGVEMSLKTDLALEFLLDNASLTTDNTGVRKAAAKTATKTSKKTSKKTATKTTKKTAKKSASKTTRTTSKKTTKTSTKKTKK